jgi:hypothetical protein
MTIIQCLGGWCRSRDKCQHYHAEQIVNINPVERLCGTEEEPEPIKPEAETEVTA